MNYKRLKNGRTKNVTNVDKLVGLIRKKARHKHMVQHVRYSQFQTDGFNSVHRSFIAIFIQKVCYTFLFGK